MHEKAGGHDVKYVARVAPVKEVTLHGVADLAYWQEQLRPAGLSPLIIEGKAQLLLSATQARFMGIRFRECIVGLQLQPVVAGEEAMPAMYLLAAWNSLRAFAWIERTMFSTPYAFGQVEVETQLPACMKLCERGEKLMDCSMAEAREPVAVSDERWQGMIYLPHKKGGPQQLFVANLEGRTEQFPFQTGRDHLAIDGEKSEVLRQLIDSNFTPQTWHVRQAAAHAKSKTYRADQFFRSAAT